MNNPLGEMGGTFLLYKEGSAAPESNAKDCANREGTVVGVYFDGGHYETFEYERGWAHLKEFFNAWSTNGNIIPGNEQSVTFEDFIV